MSEDRSVSRRGFLHGAVGATAVAGAAGVAGAQDDGDGEQEENGGGEETVSLVDFAFEPGTDEPLTIVPGTTVTFVWETNTHNIVVDSQPDGAEWEGVPDIYDAGHEESHTFEVEGDYEFHCQPHADLGMEGTIIVDEDAGGDGGAAATPVDPEHMGVPIQAHWVGVAAMLGIFGSLAFTFYVLKYGTTPHTGYPEED